MKKILLLIITILTILSGCSNYKEVEINDIKVDKIKLVSTSGAEISLGIEANNPTKASYTLTNFKAIVYRDGVKFADINLMGNSTLPKISDTIVPVNLYMHLLDPLSLLTLGLDIESWDIDEFKTDFRLTVKKGALKKHIKRNNVPVSKIIKQIKIK